MVDKLLYDLIPPGIIVFWSGSIIEIPEDWALCDGTNGTPDLRDKFIIGAGGNKAVGITGGNSTINDVINHTHDITVDESAHNHTQNAHTHVQDPHGHTINDAGHTHLTQRYPTATGGLSGFTIDTSMNGAPTNNTLPTASSTTGVTVNNSTAVNQNTIATNNPASTGITASSVDPVGGVASIDITPPFYALAYIMKRWNV